MKVAWAKQHLRSLDAAVKEFVGRKFDSISTEDDLEAGHSIGYPHDVLPIDCGPSGSGEVRFPLTRKSEVELKPTVRFNALFGDVNEGVLVTLKGLAEMHEFVCREVLPRFRRFFE